MQFSEQHIKQIVQEETRDVLDEAIGAIAARLGAGAAKLGGKALGVAKNIATPLAKGGVKYGGKALKLGGEIALDMSKEAIKSTAKQVQKSPKIKGKMKKALRKIATSKGLGQDVQSFIGNPTAAAMFIASMMPMMGLTPKKFVKIMARMNETKETHIVQVLRNSQKLLEHENRIRN